MCLSDQLLMAEVLEVGFCTMASELSRCRSKLFVVREECFFCCLSCISILCSVYQLLCLGILFLW